MNYFVLVNKENKIKDSYYKDLKLVEVLNVLDKKTKVEEKTYNAYLELKDCFIGASGVSTQGVKINDKMYSHIINPFNGSAINNYDYVFVKGNNGGLCDVLSTSFMIMDVDTVKELEKNYNVEAILYKDSKIIYSNSNLEIKYH